MFEFQLVNLATGVRIVVHRNDIGWQPHPIYEVMTIRELPEDETNVQKIIIDDVQEVDTLNDVAVGDLNPTLNNVHLANAPVFRGTINGARGLNEVRFKAFINNVDAPRPKPTKEINKPTTGLSLSQIKIGDLFKYPTLNKYTGLGGKLDIRAPTTFVGVEVELENVVLKTNPPNTCRKTDDGSLKIRGAEFITIPIQFKYLEVELDRLFGSLDMPLVSSRCSVHVHLNARDFTLDELKTFVALYMVFERSLYKLSGDRWNNIFCVPVQMYTEPVASFFSYIERYKKVPQDKYCWYKYYGLNLSPLFGGESSCIGTIEFRQMAGTVSTESIINWINLIVSLKLYAKKISSKEFLAKLEDMNTSSTYYGLAEDVFGSWSDRVVKLPDFKSDVEGGITLVKRIFFPKADCKEEIKYNFKKGS